MASADEEGSFTVDVRSDEDLSRRPTIYFVDRWLRTCRRRTKMTR